MLSTAQFNFHSEKGRSEITEAILSCRANSAICTLNILTNRLDSDWEAEKSRSKCPLLLHYLCFTKIKISSKISTKD